MKPNLKRKILKGFLSGIIFPLSSCYGTVVECDNPNNHVHKYTSPQYNIDLLLWFETNKELDIYENKYDRTDTMIDITTEDENYFKLLKEKKLTEITDESGRDFLYRQMKNNAHDIMKFYFEYYTYEEVTKTDSDGKKTTETERVHHDGWTTNPRHPDNTGDIIIYHTRFRLAKVIKENGEWVVKEISVDDPQKYWDEYNYFKYPTAFKDDNNLEVVHKKKKKNKKELPYLNADELGGYSHIDTTTEGYQNWLNEKKSNMIENDKISFLNQDNIESISLYSTKQKILVKSKNK